MLSGILDFDSVEPLRSAITRYLRKGTHVIVDLEQITSSNSAALALLLQWVEDAIDRGSSVSFRNLPAAVTNIAQLYNVSSLLPMSRKGA